jgi:hypothetical protein
MWHIILGGLMLACAATMTLFAADALEQSQSRAEPTLQAAAPIVAGH